MKNIAFALNVPYRGIAAVTLLALLAWVMGLPAWLHTARAANVDDIYDLLETSTPGVDSQHDIFFTTNTAMTSEQGFRIYFDEAGSNFSFTSFTEADLIASSTGFTAVNACGGGSDEVDLSVGPNYIQGIVCTGQSVPIGQIGIQVGDTEFLNNPSTPGSYVISLQGFAGAPSGAIADVGDTRVAIVESVTVTAAVNTAFTFSVNGVAQGLAVNGEAGSALTIGTSTATTVPFGVIPTNDDRVMAQELRVDTNASYGFSVTVQADQTLTAGNGATIDTFADGSNLAVPGVWAGPTGTWNNLNEYGHWGLTSDDGSLTGGADPFGAALYAGNFVTDPVEVFYNGAPVKSTSGPGIGSTTVAYKVEIMELQEAAKDYTATLTYIATPVF